MEEFDVLMTKDKITWLGAKLLTVFKQSHILLWYFFLLNK